VRRRCDSWLVGNELFYRCVEVARKKRWRGFTWQPMVVELRLEPNYGQKLLSRFAEKRLLDATKVPRVVMGGYRRGQLNVYTVSGRGWGRYRWLKKRRSRYRRHYLATGTGQPKEFTGIPLAQTAEDIFTDNGIIDGWPINRNDRQGLIPQFAATDPDNLPVYWNLEGAARSNLFKGFTGLALAKRLQSKGLISKSITLDNYFAVSKETGSSDTEMLLTLLLRQAQEHRKELDEANSKTKAKSELSEELVTICSQLLDRIGELTESRDNERNANYDLRIELIHERDAKNELTNLISELKS